MLNGKQSGCINHPGMEATYHCKQCSTPVCNSCVVSGTLGNFCCETCQEKFRAFAARAQAMEQRQTGTSRLRFGAKIRKFVFILVVLAILGAAGSYYEIPVLSHVVWTIRNIVGF
jgi:hypothetical protein